MKTFKNLVYYLFSSIIPPFISMVSMIVYTHYLTNTQIGEYDLILTSFTIFLPIVSLQIGLGTFRWLKRTANIENVNNSIKTVLKFSFYTHTIVLFVGYFILIKIGFANSFLFLLGLLSQSFYTILSFIARSKELIKQYAKVRIFNILSNFLISFIFLKFTSLSIESLLYGIILSNVLSTLYLCLELSIIQVFKIAKYDRVFLNHLLKFSIPIIPNALSWMLITLINRYFIVLYLGLAINGQYAISAKVASILSVFSLSFELIFNDMVFKNAHKNEENSKFLESAFVIQSSFALMLISMGKIILSNFFSIQYAESFRVMPIIIIGILLANFAGYWGVFYQELGKTIKVLPTTMMGAGINIVFTIAFIRTIGIYAPAIGTCLGCLVMLFLRWNYIKDFRKINLSKFLLQKYILLLLLYTIVIQFSNIYIDIMLFIFSLLNAIYELGKVKEFRNLMAIKI